MEKKKKGTDRPKDVNQLAHHLVEVSTREDVPVAPPNLSSYMAAIGRKGGKIGGKRRLQTMSSQKRKSIAKKAAEARWHTQK